MSEFKIEKGIALPQCNRAGFYPWQKMKVGDSFFVKDITGQKVFSAASQFGKRQSPKWKFSYRSMDGGIRVWRIK